MSKHNRERRKWKCQRCHMPMPRGTYEQGVKQTGDPLMYAHCGRCAAIHMTTGRGWRRLSPAEEFRLRVDCPSLANKFDEEYERPSSKEPVLLVGGMEG